MDGELAAAGSAKKTGDQVLGSGSMMLGLLEKSRLIHGNRATRDQATIFLRRLD
jgi:hypothetical protein